MTVGKNGEGGGDLDPQDLERRRSARYDIRLPAQVTFDYRGSTKVTPATTKDVSDEGAFLVTNLVLPTGTKVALSLRLELDSLLELIGKASSVSVRTDGTVVRNEHHGLAVRFGRKMSFQPQETEKDHGEPR